MGDPCQHGKSAHSQLPPATILAQATIHLEVFIGLFDGMPRRIKLQGLGGFGLWVGVEQVKRLLANPFDNHYRDRPWQSAPQANQLSQSHSMLAAIDLRLVLGLELLLGKRPSA